MSIRAEIPQRSGAYRALTYLLLFGLAITVPLLLLLGALLLQSASVQRAQLEERVLQVLDAAVNDLDRELDRDITILRTLATSAALNREDWRTFYDQAKAGLLGRAYLVLVDADGRQLVNTYVPYGEQPAMTGDPETVRRMLQSKAPVVSNLFVSLVVKKPVFNVSIPVVQDGQVRYVMSLGLLPDDLLALLTAENLGPEWVTMIWDANGVILARLRDNARYVGTPLPQAMREQAQSSVVRTTNLDGADVLHAAARSELSGWGVGVNIPYALITGQMRTSLLLWGAASVLAIAIALALGLIFARQITTPLAVAAGAAVAFGRGDSFPITGSRLREADAFLATLRAAQQAREKLTEEVQRSRDWLHITLSSIGDAVIATDAQGRVNFMNNVAQTLTGWGDQEASGRPMRDIFRIVNEDTRQAVENPALRAMREGVIVGLANHTVLIAKDGSEIPIDDSGAPVMDPGGSILGAVLTFRDITERRRSQRELTESRERLRVTLASIGDGVVATDANGKVTFLNPVAESLTGWMAAQAEGQPLTKVFNIVNEKTRATVENPALRAMREGVIVGLANHTVLIAKDGAEIPIDDSGAPIRDASGKIMGAVLVFRDVGDRKKAEAAMAHLAAIVESSDDAIIGKDLNGRILSWNKGAERLFGYSADEAIGKPISIIAGPYGDEIAEILRRMRRGERVDHYETRRITKDGTVVDVSLTASPLYDSEGQIIGASKIARDISGRKRVEEALKQANRHKDEFLAMVSHELRNPLAALTTAGHVLTVADPVEERAVQARDVIVRQTDHMTRLVDDLIDVSRVTMGKLTLERRAIDLAELVSGVAATWRSAGRLDGTRISLNISPVWVDADRTRIEQVFSNLLDNALKFTPSGKGVSVAVHRDGHDAVLQVSDEGEGIAPELMPIIFDPFVQGARVQHRTRGGLGLGLALVKRLVDLHGGSVEASSAGPGKGAVFTVRLAAAPVPSLDPR